MCRLRNFLNRKLINKDIEYLKKTITENIEISDIIDIFEKICNISKKDEMLLFEIGMKI